MNAKITLRPRRDKPLRQKHPWIFSGAIARVEGDPQPGDWVRVHAADDTFLATGYYNERSQIQVRVLAWGDTAVDEAFWHNKISAAVQRRALLHLPDENNTAYRLINAEADGLPGLIVDAYGDYLVLQCLTMGVDVRKEMIADVLMTVVRPQAIIERSDATVRRKEGLQSVVGVLRGDAPPAPMMVHENGLQFAVDLVDGHKTGLYLDQRENRALLEPFMSGRDVLNVCSYTGGFGLYAARAGAKSIVNLDSSVPILEAAEQNFERNGLNGEHVEYMAADAFELLRHYRDTGRQFDMIVLDPPKFVNSQKHIKRAARGYKDLNWLAMRLLRPNGVLATFSCSGLVSAELFQKIVFGASVDAKRDTQIIKWLHQAADHPVSLTFPESAYLKGLLLRVV